MPQKSAHLRTPVPRRGRLRWIDLATLAAVVVAAAVTVALSIDPAGKSSRKTAAVARPPKPVNDMTASDLAALTDAQLAAMDPLVMNLIVAREIPGLETLDIAKYVAVVDEWAKRIDAANRAAEPSSKNEPTYRESREFWMAGGMAVMLAGPAFGISYTTDKLNPGQPEQQFIHGIIDKKTGTCATMPVLYMAIGHRLGWPIHAVVSGDHMWARWDDGVPKERGGKRFNLEATSAKSKDGVGSFASMTDDEYAKYLETPRSAIQSGSDFTSLTARQTLGVFLQGRAGYWMTQGQRGRAVEDLLLATRCFPRNVDIRKFLLALTEPEWRPPYFPPSRGPTRNPYTRLDEINREVDRINRANREAFERSLLPLAPVDPFSPLNPGP